MRTPETREHGSLQRLRFDNAFVRDLPADPHVDSRRRQVQGALYSRVQPTPVAAPRLIAYPCEVAAFLGISEADIASAEFAQIFGGNALLEGMQPYAANLGGHQFGIWAGQLGDGRAITLGEVINADGNDNLSALGRSALLGTPILPSLVSAPRRTMPLMSRCEPPLVDKTSSGGKSVFAGSNG